MNWSEEHKRIRDVYHRRDRKMSYFTYEDPYHLMRLQERYRETLNLFKSSHIDNLADFTVLDVGCGSGRLLRQFIQWGVLPENVSGIELREDMVKTAIAISPDFDIRYGSAIELPWNDCTFDLVCQHTVFTSVLENKMRLQIANEMMRVTKHDGAILWYDFFVDNPKNPNVRAVPIKELKSLFPERRMIIKKLTLAPPITRLIPLSVLPVTYPLLSSLPVFRTHLLALIME